MKNKQKVISSQSYLVLVNKNNVTDGISFITCFFTIRPVSKVRLLPCRLKFDLSRALCKIWFQKSCYCAFHKHANSKFQKPPSQLRFSLPRSQAMNLETHKHTKRIEIHQSQITNHKLSFPRRFVKM